MTQYAIVTDLDRCVGCLSCATACKTVNNVEPGSFWCKTLRIGPNPMYEGAQCPDVELYFLTVQCQHCYNPACVKVCPTGASKKEADGTVQIDKEKCIGCQFCVMACPYGVRYLNEKERVVEKCTLCEQQTSQGELPQCVLLCGGRARFFGDIEQGIDNMVGSSNPGGHNAPTVAATHAKGGTYEPVHNARASVKEVCKPYSDAQVYHLPDVGNKPAFRYILRKYKWQG